MNLYDLLEAIAEDKTMEVEFFEYKESKYNVGFKPHTVLYRDDGVDYTFLSLVYNEWEDTFYITAQDSEDNLEFFRCSDGELMKVEVND